jgi:hypothetical protein
MSDDSCIWCHAPVRPRQKAVECDICSRWQHRNMGKFFFHWNISSNVQNLPYPEMTLHLLICISKIICITACMLIAGIEKGTLN